jgi:hypothetical protein
MKKKETTNLDKVRSAWSNFKRNMEKLWNDPDREKPNYLHEKLKPHLQVILDIVLTEDHKNRESKTPGECLEFVIKEGIIMDLCAYGKTDNPVGLLVLCIKFLKYIILDIRSFQIINHQ